MTRVVLLQHPRERDVAIGTARMASLCLPNSELHVGVSWEGSAELAAALSDPARPAVLLYPGDGAVDVAERPPAGPVTLVVVDGTWWQAKKLVRANPVLAALPRVAFVPAAPSEYRIRREPKETYVSTIEALAHVLGVLEGERERFAAMLVPFRAMIDAQIEHERRLHGARVRRAQRAVRKPKRPQLPGVLHERAADLVCVYGEANAWPFRADLGRSEHADDLVHWVAFRPGTGEAFERVVAPRQPLGPNTSVYTQLSAETMAGGITVSELLAEWSAFLRPTDVVCSWGHHARSLFRGAGGTLSRESIDLRLITRCYLKGRVGTLSDVAARLRTGAGMGSLGMGRAGVRLAELADVTKSLVALAGKERA